jgi:hypothetical protein
MGGATWYHEHRWGHRRERDAAWGLLTAAACGTTRCTVLDRPGGVVSTSGRGWTRPARALPRANVSYHSAFALACKGAAFCLTADVGGVTRRWNGRSWTSVAASPVDGGTELSCADPRWCAEIGTFTGAMAVFDGARWHRWPSLGQSPQPWTISCGGRGSCVAASNGIVRVLRGGHWSARHRLPGTTTNSGEDVSCTSARFCMVVADYGKIWRWDGRTWHGEAIPAFPSAVSCTSPTFCAELDFTGVQLWDGTRWTPSTTLQQPEGTAYGLIACASPALCVIGSWTSETRVGRAA